MFSNHTWIRIFVLILHIVILIAKVPSPPQGYSWKSKTDVNSELEIENLLKSIDTINLKELELETNDTKVSPFIDKIFNARSRPHSTGPELIRNNGFPLEFHNVTSSDGYITTLFRIPHGRHGPSVSTKPKKVVFLHHGVFADASSWILNAVDKALVYRLADLGNVDVWMTNNRGTYFSLGHVNLTHSQINDYAYWNFSFHEIGIFDVPKIIDYILETTNQPDLYYVAHSMGGSAFFIAMSTFPSYNNKIRTFIGLAPAVFCGNATFPFQASVPGILKFQLIHDAILMGPGPVFRPELLPYMQIIGDICSPKIISKWICFAVLDAIFGFDYKENNYDMAAEIMANSLSSTSSKVAYHLIQLWRNNDFRQYDYFMHNEKVYGKGVSPKYKLSKVTSPIALFGGPEDNLILPQDLQRLSDALPNVKEMKLVESRKFNHIDFLFATHINELLNDRLIEIIDNDLYYEKKSNV